MEKSEDSLHAIMPCLPEQLISIICSISEQNFNFASLSTEGNFNFSGPQSEDLGENIIYFYVELILLEISGRVR